MTFSEALIALSFGKVLEHHGKFLIQGKNVKAPKTHITPCCPLIQPIFIYDDCEIGIWQPSQSDFIATDYCIIKPIEGKQSQETAFR